MINTIEFIPTYETETNKNMPVDILAIKFVHCQRKMERAYLCSKPTEAIMLKTTL